VQRHRQDQVGVGEQLLACLDHPPGEQPHAVEPPAALEAQDDAAALPVVAQGGPRAVEARRLRGAAPAQGRFREGVRQGEPAAAAPRRRQQAEPAPAGMAEALWRPDLRPAGQAARRQQEVKQHATQPDGGIEPAGGIGGDRGISRSWAIFQPLREKRAGSSALAVVLV
jgi:hypothetical protein